MKTLEKKIKERAFNRALNLAKEIQKNTNANHDILQLEFLLTAIALAGIGLVGMSDEQKSKILTSFTESVKEATDSWEKSAQK